MFRVKNNRRYGRIGGSRYIDLELVFVLFVIVRGARNTQFVFRRRVDIAGIGVLVRRIHRESVFVFDSRSLLVFLSVRYQMVFARCGRVGNVERSNQINHLVQSPEYLTGNVGTGVERYIRRQLGIVFFGSLCRRHFRRKKVIQHKQRNPDFVGG